MATVRPIANTRIAQIVRDVYNELDSNNYALVVYNNPGVLTADGVVSDVALNVVDVPFTLEYNEADFALDDDLALLELTGYTTPALDFSSTLNMSGRDGSEITELQAVEQDVIYRVLTYRGTRSWRLDYSTRIADAVTYNATPALLEEARQVALLALAAASDRYTTIDVTARFVYDDARNATLVLTAVVTPLFGATPEPVAVEIPVPVLD